MKHCLANSPLVRGVSRESLDFADELDKFFLDVSMKHLKVDTEIESLSCILQ